MTGTGTLSATRATGAFEQAFSAFGPDIAGNRAASDARDSTLQSVCTLAGDIPQGVTPTSARDMPKALAAESQQRVYGPTVNRSGAANPNSAYGQGSVRTSSGIGSFAEDGQTYNVGTTSQDNIRRVTGGKLNSPLYTNIDPSQAVAGLRNQTIGQPADEAKLGIDRYQRANDIRGEMIANRDRDIPAGGYGPGILSGMLPGGQSIEEWNAGMYAAVGTRRPDALCEEQSGDARHRTGAFPERRRAGHKREQRRRTHERTRAAGPQPACCIWLAGSQPDGKYVAWGRAARA